MKAINNYKTANYVQYDSKIEIIPDYYFNTKENPVNPVREKSIKILTIIQAMRDCKIVNHKRTLIIQQQQQPIKPIENRAENGKLLMQLLLSVSVNCK